MKKIIRKISKNERRTLAFALILVMMVSVMPIGLITVEGADFTISDASGQRLFGFLRTVGSGFGIFDIARDRDFANQRINVTRSSLLNPLNTLFYMLDEDSDDIWAATPLYEGGGSIRLAAGYIGAAGAHEFTVFKEPYATGTLIGSFEYSVDRMPILDVGDMQNPASSLGNDDKLVTVDSNQLIVVVYDTATGVALAAFVFNELVDRYDINGLGLNSGGDSNQKLFGFLRTVGSGFGIFDIARDRDFANQLINVTRSSLLNPLNTLFYMLDEDSDDIWTATRLYEGSGAIRLAAGYIETASASEFTVFKEPYATGSPIGTFEYSVDRMPILYLGDMRESAYFIGHNHDIASIGGDVLVVIVYDNATNETLAAFVFNNLVDRYDINGLGPNSGNDSNGGNNQGQNDNSQGNNQGGNNQGQNNNNQGRNNQGRNNQGDNNSAPNVNHTQDGDTVTVTNNNNVQDIEEDGRVFFDISGAEGAEAIRLPNNLLNQIRQGRFGFEIAFPEGSISFSPDAAGNLISAGQGGGITVSITSPELTPAQSETIGDRPVVELLVRDFSDNIISDFKANVTVSLPYELKPNENPNAIVVYYVTADNTLRMMQGHYDANAGAVVFTTTHFSMFMIAHNPVEYADVTSGWYKDAIDFIAARGYPIGITGDLFEPNRELTRGEFTATLMRAYNVELDTNATDNFDDVDSSAVYAPYLATAKTLGIAKGIGNNKFAPENTITREEMFVLLYRILINIGEDPAVSENSKTLLDFKDAANVAVWAKEELELLLKAGMVDGTGNGMLSPKLISNRATMAQMIYNLLTR